MLTIEPTVVGDGPWRPALRLNGELWVFVHASNDERAAAERAAVDLLFRVRKALTDALVTSGFEEAAPA